MAQFTTKLIYEDDGGFPMTLVNALEFDSDVIQDRIVVPVGFKTDLASIPQFLWNILPVIGKQDAPAVIHDFLYQTGFVSDRQLADAILEEAMHVMCVKRAYRFAIYWGVRVGGWHAWNTYRHGGMHKW